MPEGRPVPDVAFPGQRIIIDPDGLNIVVEVIEVRGNKTRLSFLANPDTKIYREELLERSPCEGPPMIPITLTPGEERVLEAWRERPGTLADLAHRTGVRPVRDQPRVGAAAESRLAAERTPAGLAAASRCAGSPRLNTRFPSASVAGSDMDRRSHPCALGHTGVRVDGRGLARVACINPGSPRGGIWRPSGVRA